MAPVFTDLRGKFTRIDLVVALIASATGSLFPLVWWLARNTTDIQSAVTDKFLIELSILQFAQGVALLLWRSRPMACVTVVLSTQMVAGFLTAADFGVRSFGLMFLYFLVGYRYSLPGSIAVAFLAVVIDVMSILVGQAYYGEISFKDLAGFALLSLVNALVVVLFGAWMQARKRNDNLWKENLKERHLRNVEKAVAEERQRLARELHDVTAHHLAAIAIQAAAMRRLIDTDPEAAKEAATQLRGQAKLTLSGMRSVVEALREGSHTPGLQDVPALVDTIRELGVSIQLQMPERLPQLYRQVDAAAYRVVQQGISNALQHAPGADITVVVTEADMLRITVLNTAATRQPDLGVGGAGLQLMTERVMGLGGQLRAEPTRDGGWELVATLPLKVDDGGQRKGDLVPSEKEHR